jgi:DNA-binding NtrC family response regulator
VEGLSRMHTHSPPARRAPLAGLEPLPGWAGQPTGRDPVLALARANTPARGRPAALPADTAAALAANLVGSSAAFRDAMDLVALYAAWTAPLLIVGETGTGKELVARAVHYLSPRRHRPFIPVNCATLPETLVESELFGHTRGAFTDAGQARSGLVRQAEGGTLFLDEVEALAARGQGALLRFLQDSSYRALGGNELHQADVRIVAASNVDLREKAGAREFRDDLLYRLDAFRVALPPLRARRDDLRELVPHLLNKAAQQTDGRARTLGEGCNALLCAYDWPGNVRQLEHVLLKAHVVSQGTHIERADLLRGAPELAGAEAPSPMPAGPLLLHSLRATKRAAADLAERSFVEALLSRSHGNISEAARLGGLQRASLSRLAKKHGVKARAPGAV